MSNLADAYVSNGEVELDMFRALEKKYGLLISAAREEWESRFAGPDPSDGCVTIRINGRESRELARFFPLKYSRHLERLLTS